MNKQLRKPVLTKDQEVALEKSMNTLNIDKQEMALYLRLYAGFPFNEWVRSLKQIPTKEEAQQALIAINGDMRKYANPHNRFKVIMQEEMVKKPGITDEFRQYWSARGYRNEWLGIAPTEVIVSADIDVYNLCKKFVQEVLIPPARKRPNKWSEQELIFLLSTCIKQRELTISQAEALSHNEMFKMRSGGSIYMQFRRIFPQFDAFLKSNPGYAQVVESSPQTSIQFSDEFPEFENIGTYSATTKTVTRECSPEREELSVHEAEPTVAKVLELIDEMKGHLLGFNPVESSAVRDLAEQLERALEENERLTTENKRLSADNQTWQQWYNALPKPEQAAA